jgi:hypothetical protein
MNREVDPGGTANGIDMEPGATFDGIVMYEAAVERGTHVRALVGSREAGPLGFGWMPEGLPAAPAGLGPRTVEMEGPGGQRLFYVPLAKLGDALLAGAAQLGIDPGSEPRFRALRSLDPGSEEPYVHALFDLVAWLARQAALPPVVEHVVPFAAQSSLHVLLLPGESGRLPRVVEEERTPGDGTEVRLLVVDVGGRLEAHRFRGARLTGADHAALLTERERITHFQDALAAYLGELEEALRTIAGA